MKKANKILHDAGIIDEANIPAGKDVYMKLKIGDKIIDKDGNDIPITDVLILNNKVIEKNDYGYSLIGIKKMSGESYDIYLSAKEMAYIAKNWKKLK